MIDPTLIVTLASVFSANYGSLLLKDYLERRKRLKSQNDNMDEDYRRQQVVKPLLEDLKYHLGARRVAEIGFSNGDTTLGGYHLKKVSIITETDPDMGDEPLAPHFQLIPAKKFDRTLSGLFDSKMDWVVWDENNHHDETASLNKAFGFQTILMVTIRDQQQKWVGYLFLSWPHSHIVELSDVERVKLVASRIGGMSKQH